MQLEYHHLNPDRTNDATLLRVRPDSGSDQPNHPQCLLFDSGPGARVDSVLDPADELVGICLSHAHRDHCESLPNNHEPGRPILSSPTTATILNRVLAEGPHDDYAIPQADRVPLESQRWYALTPNIDVAPIPAGHTLGAIGFYVRLDFPEASQQDILAIGDWTQSTRCSNPGFTTALPGSPDMVISPLATSSHEQSANHEALQKALWHSHSGRAVLLATSGIEGVLVSRFLAATIDSLNVQATIALTGLSAKLYDALAYDHDAVTTHQVWTDPEEVAGRGTITIAGPGNVSEGAARRIYKHLAARGDGTLIQLLAGSHNPVPSGDASIPISHYELSVHPTIDTLVETLETLNPIHLIGKHEAPPAIPGALPSSCACWLPEDATTATLYEEDTWTVPDPIRYATGTAQTAGDLATVRLPESLPSTAPEPLDDVPSELCIPDLNALRVAANDSPEVSSPAGESP